MIGWLEIVLIKLNYKARAANITYSAFSYYCPDCTDRALEILKFYIGPIQQRLEILTVYWKYKWVLKSL